MSGWEILIVVAILLALDNWAKLLGSGAPGNRTPLILQIDLLIKYRKSYLLKLYYLLY